MVDQSFADISSSGRHSLHTRLLENEFGGPRHFTAPSWLPECPTIRQKEVQVEMSVNVARATIDLYTCESSLTKEEPQTMQMRRTKKHLSRAPASSEP